MWKPLKADETPSVSYLAIESSAIFEEAGPVIAGGRWYLMRDGTVYYRTLDGNVQLAVHTAETLRSVQFREVTDVA